MWLPRMQAEAAGMDVLAFPCSCGSLLEAGCSESLSPGIRALCCNLRRVHAVICWTAGWGRSSRGEVGWDPPCVMLGRAEFCSQMSLSRMERLQRSSQPQDGIGSFSWMSNARAVPRPWGFVSLALALHGAALGATFFLP